MLTRLLLIAAAATASALPPCPNNINNNNNGNGNGNGNNGNNGKLANNANGASSAKLLITSPGNISIADFDGTKFNIKSTTKATGNPTWVVVSSKKDVLYAVDENSDTTSLFKLDLAGNKLSPVSSTKGSSGVVHLELTKDNSKMIGAGFGSSNIDVFDTSNGGLKFSKAIASDDKLGPNTVRQEKPHPHQSVLDPSGRFMAVSDLGTDKILVLDSQNAFGIVNRVPVEPAGCGPRHGAFFPAGAPTATHYMVLCEVMNLVVLYDVTYGGKKGMEFTRKQNVSTFDSATPKEAAAGELVLAPDNKNVYASNRLTGGQTDNIANFRIVQTGGDMSLVPAGLTSTGGKLPRMFSASIDGQHLFIGNQDGELGVVALKRNADGTLAQKPVASLGMSVFPGKTAGPAFVQQIA